MLLSPLYLVDFEVARSFRDPQSSRASSFNASSRAIKSTLRLFESAIAPSSVSLCPLSRLAARRRRAYWTKICRISLAQTARRAGTFSSCCPLQRGSDSILLELTLVPRIAAEFTTALICQSIRFSCDAIQNPDKLAPCNPFCVPKNPGFGLPASD
jgi:hypothetical protein